MGRSFRADQQCDVALISLEEIHIPEKTWNKVMRRDHGQIEKMRVDYESGRRMVRVVLRPQIGGGYVIEDGRHRVIAAKLARAGCVEAIIVN